jgi:hypothetical protein
MASGKMAYARFGVGSGQEAASFMGVRRKPWLLVLQPQIVTLVG